MVASGSRVVILRPPKCVPKETMETMARLILDNHRKWQDANLFLFPPKGSWRVQHLEDCFDVINMAKYIPAIQERLKLYKRKVVADKRPQELKDAQGV